jgi:hypothetical protein
MQRLSEPMRKDASVTQNMEHATGKVAAVESKLAFQKALPGEWIEHDYGRFIVHP